jgi:hypothetical protein
MILDIAYTFDSALKHRARVFRSFAERKKLEPDGPFIKDDTLTIYCRIRREFETVSDDLSIRPNRLKTAYDSSLFTDIKIKVCDQTFLVGFICGCLNIDLI